LHLHAVDAFADNDLSMLGIADIAAKHAFAAFPPRSVTWLPGWRDAD